jgi:hypothetical protein
MSKQKRRVSKNCWLYKVLITLFGEYHVANWRYKTITQYAETVTYLESSDTYKYISGSYIINGKEYMYSYTFIIKDYQHIKKCISYTLKEVQVI